MLSFSIWYINIFFSSFDTQLYLILFDDKNLSTNETSHASVKETGYLGRLAMLSGGDIIYVPNYAFQNQVDGEMGYVRIRI